MNIYFKNLGIAWTLLCFTLPINICFAKELSHKKIPPVNQTANLPEDLLSGLTSIVNSMPAQAKMGIVIQSALSGQVLYQYQSNLLFKPASVNKLFVAISALSYLKPEYRFQTHLKTTGEISQGVLNGDLYIEFSGDPTLTDKQLIQLLDELKTLGINQINGHVYIDNSAYGSAPYPPGWLLKDLIFGYAAPLNAIILNENRFSIIINPSKKIGYPATSSSTLPDGVIRMDNQVKTGSKNQNCAISMTSDEDNTYHFDGCVDNQTKEKYLLVALRDPVKLAQILITNTLAKNQIGFSGPVQVKESPSQSVILSSHDSPPLNLIVKTLLKESDNLYTNSLLKQIGRVYFKTQGTWQNGLDAVKQILSSSAHLDFNQIQLYDGSGLSLYNHVSPQQLAKLLYYVHQNPMIAQDLWDALPIAGEDGTLKGRLMAFAKGEPIRAKTGSMKEKGVSALAGYINTSHHGLLVFVIMTNGRQETFHHSKFTEDQICQFLLTAK